MIGSIATLVLLSSLGQQPNDGKKPNDFKFDFRGAKFDEVLFQYPPETAKYFAPDAGGLRITLPGNAEQPGSHVATP